MHLSLHMFVRNEQTGKKTSLEHPVSGSQGRSRQKAFLPFFRFEYSWYMYNDFLRLIYRGEDDFVAWFYPSSIVRYCTCLKTFFLQYLLDVGKRQNKAYRNCH